MAPADRRAPEALVASLSDVCAKHEEARSRSCFALAPTGLVACGESGDATTSTNAAAELPLLDDLGGDAHVRFAADPSGKLAYNVALASASAGKATIQFVNPQSVPHNVTVEGTTGRTIAATRTIGEGMTSTTAVLRPGKYHVYCSVPGHRKAGMKGYLTVYP